MESCLNCKYLNRENYERYCTTCGDYKEKWEKEEVSNNVFVNNKCKSEYKSCTNCTYSGTPSYKYPCCSCDSDKSHWVHIGGDKIGDNTKTPDNPLSPYHYSHLKIQPIDFITENNLGFCEGNILKYVCRWNYKNGVEDLKKAQVYLNKLIEKVESNESK